MYKKIKNKFINNYHIYYSDIKQFGLSYFLLSRLIKIPLIHSVFNLIKPNQVSVNGYTLFIDKKDTVISDALIMKRIWEPHVTEIFKKNIPQNGIVVDVGAHIGYYTLIAAGIIGRKGKVLAFEPNRENYSLLVRNIQANRYRNIITENKALGEEAGPAFLYLDNKNTGDYRLYSSKDKKTKEEVSVVPLDEYLKKDPIQKSIDLIKIDIQGYEVKALRGMRDILTGNKHIKIITEFWPMGLRLAGNSASEYYSLLQEYGFRCYEINIDMTYRKTAINQLIKKYPEDAIDGTNLLCIKD